MYFQGRTQGACVTDLRGGKAKMARRVLWIAAIVIVGVLLYVGYTSYDAGRAASDGTVYSNDPSSSKHKSDVVSSTDSRDARSTGQAIVYPTPSQTPTTVVPSDQTTQPGTPGGGASASGVPTTDTLAANAPNGVRFSGTGKYLLYRQGDITYRLDTDTGFSCVLFATDEQWKKPRVYRDGCGKK
jgi:hypothetical protein